MHQTIPGQDVMTSRQLGHEAGVAVVRRGGVQHGVDDGARQVAQRHARRRRAQRARAAAVLRARGTIVSIIFTFKYVHFYM